MAWIESHQELKNHPKVRRLARALRVSVPTVIGHLHCFWWWCVDYAEDGDLTAFGDEDLSDAAMWEGDPQAFVSAMEAARWLDRSPDGERLTVHDWQDWAGRLIGMREKAKERVRKWRTEHKTETNANVTHNKSVTNAQRTTQHDMTKPNITKPSPPLPFGEVPPPPGEECASPATPAPRRATGGNPERKEVRTYFETLDLPGECDHFYDHFEANGWKVGRNPMRDWKAAARNWCRRAGEFSGNGSGGKPKPTANDLFVARMLAEEGERRDKG